MLTKKKELYNRRRQRSEIDRILQKQRAFFAEGKTYEIRFRKAALKRLEASILAHEKEVCQALTEDLGKSETEGYMCEVGLTIAEIRGLYRNVKAYSKTKRVPVSMANFPAKGYLVQEPYGVTLVMSPWNYPFMLAMEPLAGAIAAGNCCVVKPSAYAAATSAAIAKLIGDTFPPEYIAAVEGGRAENQALFEEKFDYIFFTGSVEVGKTVMQAAAKHLTPVTLELGGKSPAIVDETADIKLAARRIAFGKVLNAGQTCVEPDYLLIHRSIKEAFVSEYQDALEQFFPNGDMRDMVNIISEKHYNRVKGLIQGESIALGGTFDDERRFIAPTLLDDVSPDAPIMQQEIFGPVLPMLCFDTLSEVISFVNSRPKPLAFYIFTADKAAERRLLDSCSFGGGCVNDTIIHLASSALPFGGVGESGMGSYHGKKSFDTFTHERSIVNKSTKIDLPMRYFPYSKRKLRIIKMFMK